jgi:hypothetical protein
VNPDPTIVVEALRTILQTFAEERPKVVAGVADHVAHTALPHAEAIAEMWKASAPLYHEHAVDALHVSPFAVQELIAAARDADEAAGLNGSGVKMAAGLRRIHAALKPFEKQEVGI